MRLPVPLSRLGGMRLQHCESCCAGRDMSQSLRLHHWQEFCSEPTDWAASGADWRAFFSPLRFRGGCRLHPRRAVPLCK